ncbi:MAG: sensor domain-containing diguanylate cyclase [Rhodospirillales bacterium]|nr:sensor domain-containing diguanylate cyclase [Rhodospirillales bacterium]
MDMSFDGVFGLGEVQRLKDLRELDLLYTPAEERFDRITRLAARVLQSPMAMITLVTEEAEWIKSSFGWAESSVPRQHSFCNQAIREHHALVVADATEDERFATNPLVTGRPGIRFYAGQLLHAGAGSEVGALCVMDTLPRQLGHGELETLQDLAVIVERELSRRNQSSFQNTLIRNHDTQARRGSIDELTRTWNRSAVMELAHLECAAASMGTPLSLLLIDIDNLGMVNENFGALMGDVVLHEVSSWIRRNVRESDTCGRYGNGTFLVMVRAGILDARLIAERVRDSVERQAVPGMPMQVTVSIGVACARTRFPSPVALIAAADKSMRQAKEAGGNNVETVLL